MNRQVRTTNLMTWAILGSVLSLIVGCETPPDGGPTSTENDPEVPGRIVLDSEGVTEKATDYFQTNERYAASQNLYMCVLSRVGGDFTNYGVNHSCTIDYTDYDFWTIYQGDNNDARAICTNWNNFLIPSGGNRQFSEDAEAIASGYQDDTDDTAVWKGDAATFITGVTGEMQSNNTYVQILQATTVGARSTLRASSDEPGPLTDFSELVGSAHAYFAGVPQAQLVKLIGAHSTTPGLFVRADVNSSHKMEFSVSSASGFSAVSMSHQNSGICGFTRIAGNFDGAEERVRIEPTSDNRWRLGAWSHDGKTVYARARCMAYDQR